MRLIILVFGLEVSFMWQKLTLMKKNALLEIKLSNELKIKATHIHWREIEPGFIRCFRPTKDIRLEIAEL